MQERRSEALEAFFHCRKRKQKLASIPFKNIFTRIQSKISWLRSLSPHKASNEEYQTSDAAKDLKTSDSLSVNQIVELKEETLGSTISLHDLSPKVKSCDHVEVAAQFKSNSVKDGDIGSHSDAVHAWGIEGEENENAHALSVANDLLVVDNQRSWSKISMTTKLRNQTFLWP